MDLTEMLTPEVRLNPFPVYARLREAGGILHLEALGLWNVFRYQDVKTVLSDWRRFSSTFVAPGRPEMRGLITTDPPLHTRLRGLISKAFTPRAVAALEPRIAQVTHRLLDQVAERGQMDLVADLAAPLPVMVIAELLGIPTGDRARFKEWSDRVVAASNYVLVGAQPGVQDPRPVMQEMREYFGRIMAERRARPREDLVSQLLAADLDGERLSEDEVFAFCWLLLVAGNETTTHLIANAILTLLEHEEALAALRAQPHLLPQAIEEVLRYRSPVQAMFRTATADVEMAGETIPAGARVIAWIGSANRDPDAFPDPDRFDILRSPNPHLAFGQGIHFCLGAPLARLEARVALSILLGRLTDLALAGREPLEPAPGFIVHGVARLPLAFRPYRT